ncbi:MAG: hypothetical protein K1000chlam4_00810, partial [Chlamydiae bacterium]|nr:hypothetical protein [Chlamydiota bacterium]
YNIAPSVASPEPSLRDHKAFKEYADAKKAFKKAWRGAEGSPPSLRERVQSTNDPGFAGWKAFFRALCAAYDDSDFMMIFFELLYAVPARGTRWIGMALKVSGATAGVISKLGTVLGFISIFYLYHTSRDAYKKFKMAATAFKCGEYVASFYFVLGGSSRATFAGGIAAKPIKQAFVWAGMGANSTVKFVFSYATPLAFLVGSTMSGIRKTWEMTRTVKAYRNFKNHVFTRKDEGLAGVIRTLEEELNAPEDNRGIDDKGRFIYKEWDKRIFIEKRYTSTKRYEGLRDDSIALRLFMVEEMLTSLEEPIEKLGAQLRYNPDFNDIATLYDQLKSLDSQLRTKSDHDKKHAGNDRVVIADSLKLYEEVMRQFGDPNSLFAVWAGVDKEKASVILGKLEYAEQQLRPHAEYIQDRITSEMHRRIVYNAINLLMSVLMVVGNILIIVNAPLGGLVHGTLLLGTILTFSSAMVDSPYLIFNKLDREKGFRKVEKILSKIKLFRSQKRAPPPLTGRVALRAA